MNNYKFFWSGAYPESNFYLIDYIDRYGNQLCCSEQGYMYQKAMFFQDEDMAEKILMLKKPAEIKKAGKLVKGFDIIRWSDVKVPLMYEVVFDKFNNTQLKDWLLDQKDTIFVEASPYDLEWGIGLSEYDARQMDPSLWPGKNLLGKVLNKVQNDLLSNE